MAPPGAVKRKPTRRALIRRAMPVRRRTLDDLVQPGEQEEGAVGGEPEEDAGTGRDPGLLDLSSLYSLLQKTLQTQECEAFKQEQRWQSVQMQLNNVHDELGRDRRSGDGAGAGPAALAAPPARLPAAPPARPPAAPPAEPPAAPPDEPPAAPLHPAAPSPVSWTRAAVPKLAEGDDVEQYLTTFERLATAYRWPPADWAVFLVPYLTGRARSAYVAMDPYEAIDYFQVKEAILAKYAINAEVYRQRFRDPNMERGETPREFYNRLKDLFHKWIRPAGKTVEEIKEILILEQFMRSLSTEVRVWVKEHDPQTGHRAAELVDTFLAARLGPKDFRVQGSSRPVVTGTSGGYGSGASPRNSEQSRGPSHRQHQPQPNTPHSTTPRPIDTSTTRTLTNRDSFACYTCGKPGHLARDCPGKRGTFSGVCVVPELREETVCAGRVQIIDITVNGRPVRALLDTGSTQTLVRPFLVDQPDMLRGGRVRVCCVNGDEHEYPTADIWVKVHDQTYRLKAGIVKGLSHSVVLGQDVAILPELVRSTRPVSMVATRAQTKRALGDESDPQTLLDVMPFRQEEISPPERVREPKSRSQRRREKLFGTVEAMSRVDDQAVPSTGEDRWDIPGDLKEL